MANKVEFGISELHICTYTVGENGAVTLGTPYAQKGAVSFSPEENSEQNTFYADNIAYWAGYSGGSIEGDLEVAMFDDEFKTQFLGYKALANGGLANVKNATKPNVAIFFQVEGDSESRRVALYNCSLGAITREYSTIEESKEPATETLAVTCTGDNATGVTMAVFKPADKEYSTLFTSPTAPTFATGK
ncbi:MAG: phage tail protein [Clostridia bacterium]|nr:phage tail protein [Clostridia bacterium]